MFFLIIVLVRRVLKFHSEKEVFVFRLFYNRFFRLWNVSIEKLQVFMLFDLIYDFLVF